jgi:hypothetical protein
MVRAKPGVGTWLSRHDWERVNCFGQLFGVTRILTDGQENYNGRPFLVHGRDGNRSVSTAHHLTALDLTISPSRRVCSASCTLPVSSRLAENFGLLFLGRDATKISGYCCISD